MKARQRPYELSGGLRQRALIASAIALDPKLVIADEPTTALDVTIQAQVLDLLAESKARGRSIILISHDLSVVARLADEVIVMRGGEVLEQARTRSSASQGTSTPRRCSTPSPPSTPAAFGSCGPLGVRARRAAASCGVPATRPAGTVRSLRPGT